MQVVNRNNRTLALESGVVVISVVPLLGREVIIALPDLHSNTIPGCSKDMGIWATENDEGCPDLLDPTSKQKFVPSAWTLVGSCRRTRFWAAAPLKS